jgi:hypothetical protein
MNLHVIRLIEVLKCFNDSLILSKWRGEINVFSLMVQGIIYQVSSMTVISGIMPTLPG